MPLPGEDLVVIHRWVDALNGEMPEHVRTQLRYETDIYRKPSH